MKTFNTFRCSWCDTTNNYFCENLPGKYRKVARGNKDYLIDPFGKEERMSLCFQCYEVYQEQMDDFLKADLEKEFLKDENI